ncbi:MAG: hypothetical protein P8P29_02665 [Flavobacteriaceae bacterium]|nr:hypothetical protein [Flavobacteriaceae bacterium]
MSNKKSAVHKITHQIDKWTNSLNDKVESINSASRLLNQQKTEAMKLESYISAAKEIIMVLNTKEEKENNEDSYES